MSSNIRQMYDILTGGTANQVLVAQGGGRGASWSTSLGPLTISSLTVTALTATRVPFAGAAGLLADDADFTFAVDTLTVTKIVGGTSISTDSIIEKTGATGVTVDGVLLKDGGIIGSLLTITNDEIFESGTDSDVGALVINFDGFDGGVTRFRDFAVYNGKRQLQMFIDGSAGTTTLLTTTFSEIISCTPDAITATAGGVAASVATSITEITTDGGAALDSVTLANGTVDGQIKHFVVVAVGNVGDSVDITPATMTGGTQITFAANPIGLGCTMIYNVATTSWGVVANNGGAIA